jgi:hypothetical protein
MLMAFSVLPSLDGSLAGITLVGLAVHSGFAHS